MVYEAQTAGLVLELRAAEGESVRVGAPIAFIGAPGERVASETRETVEVGIPAGRVVAEGRSENLRRGDGVPRPKASPLARRIAAERGVDLSAVTGSGPQGRVTRADVDRARVRSSPGLPPSPRRRLPPMAPRERRASIR